MLDGAFGHPLASVAGRVREGGTRSIRYAAWRDRVIWTRRMACRQADPDLSALWRDSTVGRADASVADAPKQREGSRPRPHPGRIPHPDPHLGGATGPSPVPARDRPAPLYPLGRVEVGLQPDPVNCHATYVVFIDDPEGRGLNPRNRLARPVQAPRRPQRRQPAAQPTP